MTRKLMKREYGWGVASPDGSLTNGDLYVRADGVVVFLTQALKP